MDRHREIDGQALAHIVVTLLSLAALVEAAGLLTSRQRFVLLAVLRHAAGVAGAYATRLHAPVRSPLRLSPTPKDAEAAQLAAIFRALACALAFPARQAVRVARLAVHLTLDRPDENPAIAPGFVSRPRPADTS